MKTSIQTYLSSFTNTSILQGNYLLFDTNSLIRIRKYSAESLLEELKLNGSVFTTIHPVLVEFYNTDNSSERAQRQLLISDHKFTILPLLKENLDLAGDIQIWASTIKCFPSPTDLYLSGVMAQYCKSTESLYLISGDMKDFPFPLFERVGYFILQDNKTSELLSVMKINESELNRSNPTL